MPEDFLWWVAGKKVGGQMLVRIFKHFGLWSPSGWSYRMGDYSFDAPERQKDDGTNFGRIGGTWNVRLAVARTLEKISN